MPTCRCLLPPLAGFVDAHTHAVFSGDRCHEMKMKLAGATYVDVHKAGGGINFTVRLLPSFPNFTAPAGTPGLRSNQPQPYLRFTTSQVRHTKASSEEELAHLLSSRLDRMIAGGTTTVEVKSGTLACGPLHGCSRGLLCA